VVVVTFVSHHPIIAYLFVVVFAFISDIGECVIQHITIVFVFMFSSYQQLGGLLLTAEILFKLLGIETMWPIFV
jgi:hypothetical protein